MIFHLNQLTNLKKKINQVILSRWIEKYENSEELNKEFWLKFPSVYQR